MRRGNGKLLFNLALILIFVSPLQAACMLRCWREAWRRGWSGILRAGGKQYTGPGLGGDFTGSRHWVGEGGASHSPLSQPSGHP